MSDMIASRHRWSWRSCFAVVKHNRKTKKQHNRQSNLQKSTSNGSTHNKPLITFDENSNSFNKSTTNNNQTDTNNGSFVSTEMTMSNEYYEYFIPSSCIIKVEPPSSDDIENNFIAGDSLQQITFDDIDSSIINRNSLSMMRPTQLDSIVEDSNEENSDEFDETTKSVRLFSDREIIDDSNEFHSRLCDLSKMNHVVVQFNENGYLLPEFIRQINKLKTKIDDILRTNNQMPRDAELLEARYSTLLSTIETLSLFLTIAQIPACRSLLNRLIFSIEQRMEQLNKFVQIASVCSQRQDFNDEDFLSFRSTMSSHEHLFPLTS